MKKKYEKLVMNVDGSQDGVIKVQLWLESTLHAHATENLDMDT